MKIEFKINADESIFLNSKFTLMQGLSVVDFKKLDHTSKPLHTILLDVSDIVTKRHQAIIRKDTLFDQKKKYKVSLKYHEANALYSFLASLQSFETNNHQKMMLLKLVGQLDKKLKQ